MTIFLAHAPEDAAWADLIRRIISRTHDVVSASPDTASPVDLLSAADGLVVLLSAEYAASGMPETLWWLWSRQDSPAVVLHRDHSTLPTNLSTFKRVDISGLRADALRVAVVAAIGMMAAPSAQLGPPTDEDSFHLPSANPDFVERQNVLDALSDRLLDHGTVVLRGPNGIGKTDIALAFAHAHRATGPVGWIDASSEESVKRRLLEIAKALDLCRKDATASEVLRALRRYKRMQLLLVFDDMRSADVLQWAPGGLTRVIATTESSDAEVDRRAVVEVSNFSRAESTAFVCRHLPGFEVAEADVLAEVLGDNPGRLKHAVTAIRTGARPKTDYIRDGMTASTSSQPVSLALPLSTRLARSYPRTLELIRVCTAMNSAPVPLKIFQAAIPLDEEPSARLAIEPERLIEFIEHVDQLRLGVIQPQSLRDALYARQPELRRTPSVDHEARRQQRELFAYDNWGDVLRGSIELDRSIRTQIVEQTDPRERDLSKLVAESLLIHSQPDSVGDPTTWRIWRDLEALALPPSVVPKDPAFHAFVNAAFASRLARAGASKVFESLSVFYRSAVRAHQHREETVVTEALLATCEYGLGKLNDALKRAEMVRSRRMRTLGTRKRQTLEALLDLALYKCELGATNEASSVLGETSTFISKYTDAGRETLVTRSLYIQALILQKGKKYDEAMDKYGELIADKASQARNSTEYHRSRRQEALCLIEIQDVDEAISRLDQLLTELRDLMEPGHEDIGAVEKGLALAHHRKEQRTGGGRQRRSR
jgi:tetratricopeptide (TPR) repeat protein